MLRSTLLPIILVCTLLQGCISFNGLADAREGQGTGQIKEYTASEQDIWIYTLSVIKQSDLKLVAEDVPNGVILAQQPISPLSLTAGQNVAVFVTKQRDRTRVEVVSRKAIGEIEFVSRNWETFILEKLNERFI